MRKFQTIPCLFAFALLGACAAQTSEQDAPISEADAKIAEAMETAANANRAVSEVEVAVAQPRRASPGQVVPAGVQLPEEIRQPISVDWQGRVEPLLQTIAARAGYTFNVIGRAPANPVLVTITAENEPLFDIVRRIGNMVDDTADVALNPASRIIELRYGG